MSPSPTEAPFEIVTREGEGPAIRRQAGTERNLRARIRALPGARRLLELGPIERLVSVLLLARLFRQPAGFAFRELRRERALGRYRLRSSGLEVLVRHDTPDIWTLSEIWYLGLYQPPPRAQAALEAGGGPRRVVDLGANIGLYGAWLLSGHPGASITAFEPDPENAGIHRRCIEANGLAASWRLVEACAATGEGTVSFVAAGDTGSHIAAESEPGPMLTLPAVDVFPHLERVDLLKLDIEGGEWALLADPRFGEARVVVLEYHPHLCPSGDPHAEVDRLLAAAGYELAPVYRGQDGHGMMWAWKPGSGSPAP